MDTSKTQLYSLSGNVPSGCTTPTKTPAVSLWAYSEAMASMETHHLALLSILLPLSLSPSSPSLSLRLPPFLFFLILLFLCLSTLGFLKPSYQRDMGRSYIFRYFQVPPTPALKPPQTEVKEIREERSLLNPAPIADL